MECSSTGRRAAGFGVVGEGATKSRSAPSWENGDLCEARHVRKPLCFVPHQAPIRQRSPYESGARSLVYRPQGPRLPETARLEPLHAFGEDIGRLVEEGDEIALSVRLLPTIAGHHDGRE